MILKPNIFLLSEWWFGHHNSTNLWRGTAIRKSDSWIWYLHSGNILKKERYFLLYELNMWIEYQYIFIYWHLTKKFKPSRMLEPYHHWIVTVSKPGPMEALWLITWNSKTLWAYQVVSNSIRMESERIFN